MTSLAGTLLRPETKDDKLSLIRELRSDAEFLSGVKRGLEARRRGDRLHWNDVKVELGIE
jgi:hypothetical protein